MRTWMIAIVSLGMLGTTSPGATPDLGLPALHKIATAILQPSYGCRPPEDFAKGYGQTALFLSDYGRRRNTPDFLFNGACGAEDEFQAATAGDDMSLIADLGPEVRLEELSASKAFNLKGVHAPEAESRFVRTARVVLGHTYAVLLNGSERRGLLLVAVDEHVPNKRVAVRYAAKLYQVKEDSSPGFDWDRGNTTQRDTTSRRNGI
jgi:hypothetical protein